MRRPIIDLTFPHAWEAEIVPGRPLILPPRHFVYPRDVEEVERGALEVLVRPLSGAKAPDPCIEPTSARLKSCPVTEPHATGPAEPDARCPEAGTDARSADAETKKPLPFLATCALGFRDAAAATGVWAAPNANEICCVAGGYAYVIDTAAPEQFTMIAYRPVLEVRAATEAGLLLFVGNRNILAWGAQGQQWESEKLSDEGVTITEIEDIMLRGMGWNLMTDKETPFALDLRTGRRIP
jgi:hypothetical protein